MLRGNRKICVWIWFCNFLFKTLQKNKRNLFLRGSWIQPLVTPPPQTFTVPDAIHPEILSIINLNVFKLSLWRKANNRDIIFRNVLRRPVCIINSFDITKLSCNIPHRHWTTVSLRELTPLFIYGVTVDGNWAQWGRFSRCSRRCSGGVKRRYRSCSNPRPSNGGKQCPGEAVEEIPCNTRPCSGNTHYGVPFDLN